jgi:hypothetical protein
MIVGHLLEGVVVPELDLDAAVALSALLGVVRGDRAFAATTIARHPSASEIECVLQGEGHPVRAGLGDR